MVERKKRARAKRWKMKGDERGRDTRDQEERRKREKRGPREKGRKMVEVGRGVVCPGSSGFFKEIVTISRYCSQGETPRGENEPRRRRGAPRWPRLNRNSAIEMQEETEQERVDV